MTDQRESNAPATHAPTAEGICNRREDVDNHNKGVASHAPGKAADRPKRHAVLEAVVSIAISVVALCTPARAADGAAGKLMARVTELSEIVPGPKLTDIDLFGIGTPPHEVGDQPLPPFHIKGKILSLFEDKHHGQPARNYFVIVDDDSTYWEAISFQTPSVKTPNLDEVGSGTDPLKSTSVRFYNGKLDGHKATLIFHAARDWHDLFARSPSRGVNPDTPTRILFSLFELRADFEDDPGLFVKVANVRSVQKYCNTDLALLEELALPMPQVYSANNITKDEVANACNVHQ
jgi:hypothetical protein